METIPPIFWMIIITALTGFVCFVLYQLGMLFKESKSTVLQVRETLLEAQDIIRDAKEMLSAVKGTVIEINSNVLIPVRRISSMLGVASSFVEGLTSKRR